MSEKLTIKGVNEILAKDPNAKIAWAMYKGKKVNSRRGGLLGTMVGAASLVGGNFISFLIRLPRGDESGFSRNSLEDNDYMISRFKKDEGYRYTYANHNEIKEHKYQNSRLSSSK